MDVFCTRNIETTPDRATMMTAAVVSLTHCVSWAYPDGPKPKDGALGFSFALSSAA
jgi:hypothetical protein